MTIRLISAAVLLPVVAFVVFAGGPLFTAATVIATLLAGYELFSLMKDRGHRPFLGLGLATIVLLAVDDSIPLRGTHQGLLAAAVIASLLWPLAQRQRAGSLENWALTVAGSVYIGGLAAHMVMLRALPGGLWLTAIAMLGTWFTDSGAYIAGKRFGRNRLAPRISPKKTWEGAIGGGIAGTLVTVFLASYLLGMPTLLALALGILLAAAAVLGDLIESWIKRQLGAKDSGKTIPGHGGMLDRIDSLLLAGVVVYYFALFVSSQ